jgi:hypothetical protein
VAAVILDELQTDSADGRTERSARLRWVGGEFRLHIKVPEGFQPRQDDATAYMLAALPLALYRGEDLYVDGSVSALTLHRTERIQSIYASWDPAVRRCRVRSAYHGHRNKSYTWMVVMCRLCSDATDRPDHLFASRSLWQAAISRVGSRRDRHQP